MPYTTVEDVINTLPHRKIDNESVVTIHDVGILLTAVDKIVVARLKIAGHDVTSEIVAASYTDALEVIETLMTAGWVEQRFKGDTGGDEGDVPNNNYYKEGSKLLDNLAENNEFDEVPDITSVVDSITDGDDELEPHFNKNTRDW
jgi:hypothetical protein